MKSIAMIMGLMMLAFFTTVNAEVLTLNAPAPEFELSDQNGDKHTVADYQGKWVVLYFYPKNDTPGCTTQACDLRDEFKVLSELDTQILGVSVDDQESHADFAEKYSLPFPLLADQEGDVSELYGALVSLGPVKFAKRHTIIIGPEGNIRKIYRSVNASRHSQEVISALKALRAETVSL